MTLISITQRLGSGGEEIAKKVSQELDLELYDDERLKKEADNIGLQIEEGKWLNEKAPGFFDRMLSNKPDIYLHTLEAVIYEVAQKNQGVVMGHGSQFLLRDFGCALHIFVRASKSTRIANLQKSLNLNKDAAEKLINKKDYQQDGFFRYAFHMDIDDSSLYDLLINTEKMDITVAGKLISEVAVTPQISTCSLNALKSMEELYQIKKVETALLEQDLDINHLNIEIQEKGVISISGWTYSEEMKEEIISVARKVPGINEVKAQISYMPPGY